MTDLQKDILHQAEVNAHEMSEEINSAKLFIKEYKPRIFKNCKASDEKLWKVFSMYIRLRDADENGICTCFTCGRRTIWNKNTDCGHGISRQHLGTKYSEKNNHAQCKPCNGFEGGKREIYKTNMDKKYGPGTWDLIEASARRVSKVSQFDIDVMEKHYKEQVKILLKEKGL